MLNSIPLFKKVEMAIFVTSIIKPQIAGVKLINKAIIIKIGKDFFA